MWIAEFEKKYGPENLSRLQAKEITLPTLLDEISSVPFLAEKRLVIVQGIPSFAKEDIEMLPKSYTPTSCSSIF